MTLHRVRIFEQGDPSVLKYEALPEPLPPPGPGQARIRHTAIGVNFLDTMFRDGTIPAKLPFDMGIEAAWVIEEIASDVEDLAVGDKFPTSCRLLDLRG